MIITNIYNSTYNKRFLLMPRSVWWILIIIECVVLYLFITHRNFHIDEFESIHSGWKIQNGERIYVDFIQQKNPLLYYILAELIRICGETINTIYVSNCLILVFSAGIIFFSYKLSYLIFSINSAKITALILPILPWFMRSGYEIRPDVPMLFFSIASLYYLYRYFDKKNTKIFLLSATLLCISFLFIQKAIFFFIFISAIILHRYIRKEIEINHIILFYSTILIVYLIFLFLISFNTSLSSYFFFTYKFVQARQAALGGSGNISEIINEIFSSGRYAWLILPSFLISIIFIRMSKPQLEIAWGALWLLLTVLLVAQIGPRYFLYSMPFVMIIISHGLVKIADINRTLFQVLIIVLIFIFTLNIKVFINANNLPGVPKHNRYKQLDQVRYVLNITDENDYVYDGVNRFNLYRKDLDFIWLGGHKDVHLSSILSSLISYHYDIYELIYEKKPNIITHYYLDTTKYSWILKRYKRSPFFKDIYIIIKNNTGFDYWYTFVDSYNIGSEINPDTNIFTPEGNIQINLRKASRQFVEDDNSYLFPYAGIGMQFYDPAKTVDLTDTNGLILTYKLTGPVTLCLVQEGIPPGEEYRVNLPNTKGYINLKLQWSDFSQPAWVKLNKKLDLAQIKGIQFQISSDKYAEAKLGIQSIDFNGHTFDNY